MKNARDNKLIWENYIASFDPKELAIGIPMEMKEHGLTEEEAKKVAEDHLKEHPNYYSKLKECGL